MSAPLVRFPAEWEPQSAVMIAWPNAATDWAPRLPTVETTYVALACAVAARQPLLIIVSDQTLRQHAERLLRAADAALPRIHWIELPYDDTWLRDTGPITLRAADDFRLLDLRFTGWGGKFGASEDDRLIERCFAAGIFSPRCHRQAEDFALEGGAIETDGAGTLLTTWRCLHQRHPQLDRAQLSTRLASLFAQQRVIILEHGYLEGDDTDAHIDTLVRFAARDAIVFQGCDDPADSHYAELTVMRGELAALRTAHGHPYRLFELPWAQPVLDDGRRLAASYANYLLINGALLMPAYGDAADRKAAAVLQAAHPDRQIVPVPCRPLIWQNGSLHCVTMQLPEGVFGG